MGFLPFVIDFLKGRIEAIRVMLDSLQHRHTRQNQDTYRGKKRRREGEKLPSARFSIT